MTPNEQKLRAVLQQCVEAMKLSNIHIGDLKDVMCGQGLEVVNWHLNGDLQSMDTFFEDNDNDSESAISSAIAAARELLDENVNHSGILNSSSPITTDAVTSTIAPDADVTHLPMVIRYGSHDTPVASVTRDGDTLVIHPQPQQMPDVFTQDAYVMIGGHRHAVNSAAIVDGDLVMEMGEPASTADKLNRLADVMEECGVIYIEPNDAWVDDFDIQFGQSQVNVKVVEYLVGLQPADLRLAAKEI